MDVDAFRDTAVAAAHSGAHILLSYFGNLRNIAKKGAIDLVTEADTASEAAIMDILRRAYPDHAFLGEEGGRMGPDSPYCWVVDPLDGTTNFAHGLGQFAVSIALIHETDLVCGVVLNPVAGELYSAVRGGGAFCNGRRLRVSDTADMADSLLVTGFPYNVRELLPEILTRIGACLNRSRGVRRLGAAALDLCHVANGQFEGFWEQHLKPWDTAAGVLIAVEAGASVTDINGEAFDLRRGDILATNGRIHAAMVEALTLKEHA